VIALSPGAKRRRLTFTSNMKEAVSKVDFEAIDINSVFLKNVAR
jgi:hypothetical protein